MTRELMKRSTGERLGRNRVICENRSQSQGRNARARACGVTVALAAQEN